MFDNLTNGYRGAGNWGPLVVGDLSDGALLRETLMQYQVAGVIHFAAHAYVGESILHPRKYFANNCTNSLSLLDAMVDVGVGAIVFSSSCATYGLPVKLPITESHQQQPISPYGASKLFVENALRWYEGATRCGTSHFAISMPLALIRMANWASATNLRRI